MSGLSILSDKNLSINILSDLNGKVIPIGLEVGEKGEYVLSANWSTISAFDNISAYLEDRKNSKFIKLLPDEEITVESNPNDDIHRFNLFLKYSGENIKSLETNNNIHGEISVFSHDDRVYVDAPDNSIAEVYIYNMNGQMIQQQGINGGLESIKINEPTGYYIVKVIFEQKIFTEKVIIMN